TRRSSDLAPRPPDAHGPAVALEPYDRVLPDGVGVESAADEREVVEVRAAGQEAHPPRDERTVGERARRAAGRGPPGARRDEVEDLVRVARARDVHDAAAAV